MCQNFIKFNSVQWFDYHNGATKSLGIECVILAYTTSLRFHFDKFILAFLLEIDVGRMFFGFSAQSYVEWWYNCRRWMDCWIIGDVSFARVSSR